jgi:hypothetical protein
VKLPRSNDVWNVVLALGAAAPVGVGLDAMGASLWIQFPIVGVVATAVGVFWERVTG